MRGQQCSKSQLNGGGTGGTTVFYTTMAYGGVAESMCVHVRVLAQCWFSVVPECIPRRPLTGRSMVLNRGRGLSACV